MRRSAAQRTPDRRSLGWILGSLFVSALFYGACAGQPACERNSDCDEGYCNAGECVKDCVVADLDCPRGFICNELGQCEDPIGSGGSGQGGATGVGGMATTTGSMTTSTGGMTTSTGGMTTSTGGMTSTSTGAGGAPPMLGELELCQSDAQCNGNLVCRAMTKGGAMRCTTPCSSNTQCPSGSKCLPEGNNNYCFFSDVGRSCTVATQCNFACIVGVDYCTVPCNSGSDCPNGYGCMPIGSPAQNVCVKAEALCDGVNNSACIAPAACDTSPNMILGGCTTTCNTAADCPQRGAGLAPWTCDGLCRRPSDVYGPLPGGYNPTEWHCDGMFNPVVLCNDAQHIDFQAFNFPPTPAVDCFSNFTTTGAANDSCVNSCTFAGGCSDLFQCVGLGSINGNRIGLCLPHGTKEPGQACSTNVECAFGYCYQGTCSRDCSRDNLCPGGLTCTAGGGPNIEGLPFKRCL